jgi:hypothetical protein
MYFKIYKHNPALGKWVSKQRDFYREMHTGKSNRMTKEKIAKLLGIGFRFYIGKGKALRTWEIYYNALVQFKEKYGHTNIPLGHKDDPNLGRWAYQQRLNFANHFVLGRSITAKVRQRLDQLKTIGFNFHVDKKDTVRRPSKCQKRERKRKRYVHQKVIDSSCCTMPIGNDAESSQSTSITQEPESVEPGVSTTEE